MGGGWGVRGRAIVVAVAVLASLVVGTGRVSAQESPGAALVEICSTSGVIDLPEIGPRTCISLEAGSVLAASLCDDLPIPAEACANLTDGRLVDEPKIIEFEQSWVWRALRLQGQLDRDEPLRNSLVPHTHNSFNTTAGSPTLANADPNQRYSMLDQLRMGIRGIEMDLHWVPSPAGTIETGGKAVVLCHGRSESVADLTIHLGCSADRVPADGLQELRTFLDTPGNEDQFVLLYLENQLEDDLQAHLQAAAAIEAALGEDVERPPTGSTCAPAPMDASRAEMLGRGHRVLIVGNCGPGAWGGWVFDRGPLWQESGSGGDYPAYPDCIGPEHTEKHYDTNFVRRYEDRTWLSAMVDGQQHPLAPDAVRAMVRCGVDMVGFDRLEPFDGRLEALVWSWAPDEPVVDAARACAQRGSDGRFRMRPCSETRQFACRTASGDWIVPAERRVWSDGEAVCAAADATFAVPPTGWQNEQLGAVAAGAAVWIPIGIADIGGTPADGTSPAPGDGDARAPLPATGRSTPLIAPAIALLMAIAIRRLAWGRAASR